jgi:hypothetical protein
MDRSNPAVGHIHGLPDFAVIFHLPDRARGRALTLPLAPESSRAKTAVDRERTISQSIDD